jgi:hypothetical protein
MGLPENVFIVIGAARNLQMRKDKLSYSLRGQTHADGFSLGLGQAVDLNLLQLSDGLTLSLFKQSK